MGFFVYSFFLLAHTIFNNSVEGIMNKKTKKYQSALLKGTDADPFQKKNKTFSEETAEICEIRQKSLYNDKDRARVDNNQFFETKSNPLSSKGN